MLEAVDYDNIDNVSTFLGCLVDRMCGIETTEPVTKSFKQYVDMFRYMFRRYKIPGWTDAELERLSIIIRSLKIKSREVFGKYQKSGMGTSKLHSLDHVVDDLRQTGSM